jgi:porin
LFTLSNIDAPDSVRLFELWYEHAFLEDHVSVRLGQLAADEEFAGTEYGCLFINGTCGWPAILAANIPSPAYPVGAPGARVAFHTMAGVSWQTGIFDGDPFEPDSQGNPRNRHGLDFHLGDGALVVSEIGYEFPSKERPGRAKLGAAWHTGEFANQRRDRHGRSLADPASTGEPHVHRGDWAIYVAAEKLILGEASSRDGEPQGLGLFSRFGHAPEDRNFIAWYAELGAHYTGLLPQRDQDRCGIAVVSGYVSPEAKALARDLNARTGAKDPIPDHEMIVEATYRIQVRESFSLQPSVEWIVHPGASSALDNALVLGLRVTAGF